MVRKICGELHLMHGAGCAAGLGYPPTGDGHPHAMTGEGMETGHWPESLEPDCDGSSICSNSILRVTLGEWGLFNRFVWLLQKYLIELEGKNFVVIPLLGRFKGEMHSRYHLMPLVAKASNWGCGYSGFWKWERIGWYIIILGHWRHVNGSVTSTWGFITGIDTAWCRLLWRLWHQQVILVGWVHKYIAYVVRNKNEECTISHLDGTGTVVLL
jgi:hypothetical protein